MNLLITSSLSKKFPGVLAVRNFDFDLRKGEIHAIVGENGAGKSTVARMIGGVIQPTSGKILLNGNEVVLSSPRVALNLGIGVVHQERQLVPFLTGIENIFLGQEPTSLGLIDEEKMYQWAEKISKKYDVGVNLRTPIVDLSNGQQVLIEILRILARNPRIIVFDEPTAALSVLESKVLFKLIYDLKKRGISIVYISHRLQEILDISDRITVMRNGKKVITVENANISEGALIKMMINKDLIQQFPKRNIQISKPIVEVKEYSCKRYGLKDINFEVFAGEIVGFSGLIGSGRSELAKVIYTGTKIEKGKIFFNGESIKIKNPRDAIRKGIVLVPEDGRKEGLITTFNVKENLTLPLLHNFVHIGFISEILRNKYSFNIIDKLSIQSSSLEQEVSTLSGGNQQKVSLGKWMGSQAKLWIFDDSTQGIDVETKTEIYNIMQDLAEGGAGIIFISSDLREITAMADRIYVMKDRRIVKEFKRPFEQEEILKYMIGG